MINQRTIEDDIIFEGIGVHFGSLNKITLKPASANNGIRFFKIQEDEVIQFIPFRPSYVFDTRFSTTIGDPSSFISTTEHLMAVIYALNIDNLDIYVEGEEIPILDGSALNFWAGIQKVGIRMFDEKQHILKPQQEILIENGDAWIKVTPSNNLNIRFHINFPNSIIKEQNLNIILTPNTFVQEIMAARTFGFLKDYEYLLDKGFAKGSSADNTVIVGEKEIVNPSKLNHPFDFVRHKTLDLIGDLALLGRPLHANIRAHCSGHGMNYELVKKILDICK